MMNANAANAQAYLKSKGNFGGYEMGYMAGEAGNEDSASILQGKLDQAKQRVKKLQTDITGLTKDKQKKQSLLKTTTERWERVAARYAQREKCVKEYEKTINSLKAGQQSLKEATAVMLETMQAQDAADGTDQAPQPKE